jgi:hypothetical protein
MHDHRVNVFFYGSLMNFDVLAGAGIDERPYQAANLPGYRLWISPFANLVSDNAFETFGILTQLTHKELDQLYITHAQGKLGAIYLPKAVLVHVNGSEPIPALCYISHSLETKHPEPDYLEHILEAARNYDFPPAYINHIVSMASRSH